MSCLTVCLGLLATTWGLVLRWQNDIDKHHYESNDCINIGDILDDYDDTFTNDTVYHRKMITFWLS